MFLGSWRDVWFGELERRFEAGLTAIGDERFPSAGQAAIAVARQGNLTRSQVAHWFTPRLAVLVEASPHRAERRRRIQAAIDSLMAAMPTREDFTWGRVEKEARTTLPIDSDDLRQQFRRLRGSLPRRDPVVYPQVIVVGTSPRRLLRRAALRPDIADLAWDILLHEVGRVDRAPSSVARRYAGFRQAGYVLGGDNQSLRDLSLEALQTAWYRRKLTVSGQRHARNGLLCAAVSSAYVPLLRFTVNADVHSSQPTVPLSLVYLSWISMPPRYGRSRQRKAVRQPIS